MPSNLLDATLAYDLNSFMILSGRVSAFTIICTWLDLTCASQEIPTPYAQCLEYIRILEQLHVAHPHPISRYTQIA